MLNYIKVGGILCWNRSAVCVGTALHLAPCGGVGSRMTVKWSKSEAPLTWCECNWLCTCLLPQRKEKEGGKTERVGSARVVSAECFSTL